MPQHEPSNLAKLLNDHDNAILSEWIALLAQDGGLQKGRVREAELRAQCQDFLRLLGEAVASGNDTDTTGPGFAKVRDLLSEISRSQAMQGVAPGDTATFIFSLKQPLFRAVTRANGSDAGSVANQTWAVTLLLDKLGLYTMDVFRKAREEIIIRQQQEISELSTPVVKLWNGILALPLIGTLDSARTQVVMENLLQSIVETEAEIAIIDITGVPTVDTLVAQHLLKTVAAARLMGADCIISGIRPQIAQTMVHLGVELNVISKASLADAFALALQRIGKTVTPLHGRD